MAQVLVQNRVSLAVPRLPDVIKQTGVIVRKRAPDMLMGVAITSPDGRYDQLYLSNYAVMQIKDELARVPGVSDIILFGQRDYSIRVWVDPEKLASRNMTAGDVVAAIREQNAQVATGVIGSPPVRGDQAFEITLNTLGRLDDVEQFENIILKSTHEGRVVRVKDVARVELGAKNQDVSVMFDGKPTVFLPIFQLPDANALETHDRVVAKMQDLAREFSRGHSAGKSTSITTPYTRESINEVFKALRDAIILVAIVVLVFLQNWRSSIIPLVAVPVAIVGTFAAMAVFGFSLNNLTLFGLVLAIGIVVDDAIVVVEAVEHHIEYGHDAARRHDPGHAAGLGPGDRRGAGAQRGVRSLRVHQRHHGPVLPAIRADDLGVDDHFGVQLADAQPGADGAAAASAGREGGASVAVAGVHAGRRLARL